MPSHRTPLKRVSQGSLFALSRSQQFQDDPHGIGFLEPAMAELADEYDTLLLNLQGMKKLSDSLATFNESFANYLHVMNMNALTTDWPQMPTEDSYILAKRRAEAAETEAATYSEAVSTNVSTQNIQSMTSLPVEAESSTDVSMQTNKPSTSTAPTKKKSAKPKMTAKQKKERSLEIERLISCLPLEFRGSDPNLRRNMEQVIEGLLNAKNRGLKLTDLVKTPDLVQARVNKCLIALVNRKAVRKDNSTGMVLYHWVGIP